MANQIGILPIGAVQKRAQPSPGDGHTIKWGGGRGPCPYPPVSASPSRALPAAAARASAGEISMHPQPIRYTGIR
jgi:hypothetical protein